MLVVIYKMASPAVERESDGRIAWEQEQMVCSSSRLRCKQQADLQ